MTLCNVWDIEKFREDSRKLQAVTMLKWRCLDTGAVVEWADHPTEKGVMLRTETPRSKSKLPIITRHHVSAI